MGKTWFLAVRDDSPIELYNGIVSKSINGTGPRDVNSNNVTG